MYSIPGTSHLCRISKEKMPWKWKHEKELEEWHRKPQGGWELEYLESPNVTCRHRVWCVHVMSAKGALLEKRMKRKQDLIIKNPESHTKI